ncbi:autotransporter outer membrane beta-barrel domain-containing protein [Pleomorphomonas sp. JP5]|uniref:autotransporter outer membrane beta-barrel domain-containing protein n=1 Tax=Pleomorphomonas sp. JP5 TaxID=2942998 RepID=UPI002044BC13|nr:autotransporter outer membrane beta-barrel domain-containing protein [Pleomorphomonas sp. JP5]MCM5557535.1 autotransporter outer membrane beta-barrel domain-containing protein [Pleomorphomonas sp. JP5]
MAEAIYSRRFLRSLDVASSALAVGVVAASFPACQAWAGDVDVNTAKTVVYGNSDPSDPQTLDTSASSSNNTLRLLTGANVTQNAYGGYADATTLEDVANSNVLTMSGGTVDQNVYGGYSNQGSASSNTVTISGTSAIAGDVIGGWTNTGNAENNTVDISGGAFGAGTIVGGRTENMAASGNTVTISGGTFASSIIAGGISEMGAVTGNTVTISGATTTFSNSNMSLYGGLCQTMCAGGAFSGNTLNLKIAGLTVGTLAGFQYLNFYLPTALSAGDTMLRVTNWAYLTNFNSVSSVINVGINGASSALDVGDSVTLIHAGTLSYNAGLNGTATGVGMQGVTLSYVFDITATSTDLIATVQSAPTVADQSKVVSEGFVSGASLVNEGADLAAGKGMANAIGGAGADWSPFAAVSGGSIRTNTGSHVDVDGVSLVAGLSRGVDISIGRLTAGAFAEFGSGNYDTFNGFASGDIRGHGNSHYVGGGLLGHQDFRPMGPGHAYAEGAARVGVANNNYSSADLTSGGVAAGYDTSSSYYGVSAAVGYVWSVGEAMTVDVSGKYIWSRLGSDSVQLTTGETVDFEAVTSERTRLGARVSYALSNKVTPYAGAAWEHEFDGKARASTSGFAIDAPSMAGDTGIFEAGLTLKPSDDLPLSIDLGLQGFVGQREGLAGSFQAKLAF